MPEDSLQKKRQSSEENESYNGRYGNRKFLICIVILVIATIGLFISRMESSDWVDLSRWVALTYLGANVAQKKVER